MPSTLGIVANTFNPLRLDPAFWFDAADTSTITSSGSPAKVSQWSDKSRNGRNVTQSTAANQPTTGATTKNGRNILDFDGTSDYLGPSSTGFDPASNGVTVFTVTNTVTSPLGFINALSQQDLNGTGRGWVVKQSSGPHSTFLGGGAGVDVGTNSDGWRMHTIYCESGSNKTLTLAQNSTTIATATRTLESTTGGIVVGIGKSLSVASAWQSAIAEIIIYGKVLTASQIGDVERYLNTKWAVY